jgi:oligoendopeptidase F
MNAPQWDLSIVYSGIDDPKLATDIAFVREHLQVDLAKPDFWQASVDIARSEIETFERLLPE